MKKREKPKKEEKMIKDTRKVREFCEEKRSGHFVGKR